MAGQDFDELLRSGLLRDVEEIVVEGHRALTVAAGRRWSAPQAYRWLRYEDPDPIERLRDGVKKLRRRAVTFDSQAVDKACIKASKMGYSI